MVPGIKRLAVRVGRSNWRLFSGLASAIGTLNGDGLPVGSFRCAVTLSAITGHADVVGSVTIGSETLSFNSATRKTTTNLLTALPVCSQVGLDCNVLIEAIGSGGAPILKETLTSILIGYNLKERLAADGLGNFTIKEFLTKTTDTECEAGGVLRIDGSDYIIAEASPKCKPSGREFLRKLVLRQ